MKTGLVTKSEANFYSVAFEQQLYLCTVRAKLKKGGFRIKVGDRVQLKHLEDERPVIFKIQPRKSEIKRPPLANIDQVIIVMSGKQPRFNAILVDRLLLAITSDGFQPLIAISKSDLLSEAEQAYWKDLYRAFPVYFFSSETGEGIEEFKPAFKDKVSVLAGASGVGKSSLVNRLNPDCELITGEVNQKMGTGKHTTRHVSLHPVGFEEGEGWIADSPGFRAFDLPHMNPQDLISHYPEFLPLTEHCAFSDCLHDDEQGCALAENEALLESLRYANYLKLLDEIKATHRQERYYLSSKKEGLTKRAVGKNQENRVLKLGTSGRARSRRRQKQDFVQLQKWQDIDLKDLDDEQWDEWRI